MPMCCVYKCTNREGHCFPKDPKLRKLWMHAVRRKNWTPTKTSLVCRAHFNVSDYIIESREAGYILIRKRLKPNTVPTIFHWFKDNRTDCTKTEMFAARKMRLARKQLDEGTVEVETEGIEGDMDGNEDFKVKEELDEEMPFNFAFENCLVNSVSEKVRQVLSEHNYCCILVQTDEPNSFGDKFGWPTPSNLLVDPLALEPELERAVKVETNVEEQCAGNEEFSVNAVDYDTQPSVDNLSAENCLVDTSNFLVRGMLRQNWTDYVRNQYSTYDSQTSGHGNIQCTEESDRDSSGNYASGLLHTGTSSGDSLSFTETKGRIGKKPTFKCNGCLKVYKLKSVLTRHLFNFCTQSATINTEQGSLETSQSEKQSLRCSVLSQKLKQNKEVVNYKQIHSRSKPVYCSVCQKFFTSELYLKNHLLPHRDHRPLSNNICVEELKLKRACVGHKQIQSVGRPFQCAECEESFKTKGNLKTHMASHEEERGFSCVDCGQKFKCKGALVQHMQWHGGGKYFHCAECTKVFKTNQALATHMIICHSTERAFRCSVCGEEFKRQDLFVNHLLVHSGDRPFLCAECQKSFALKWTLTTHMISHSKERPFGCTICNKKFKSKGDLGRHNQVHSEEKRFLCGVCEKSYRTKGNLFSHTKTHRGSDFIVGLFPMDNSVEKFKLRAEKIFLNVVYVTKIHY